MNSENTPATAARKQRSWDSVKPVRGSEQWVAHHQAACRCHAII